MSTRTICLAGLTDTIVADTAKNKVLCASDNMETFGGPDQSRPAATYGNAGAVRPIDGLGFEPEFVA